MSLIQKSCGVIPAQAGTRLREIKMIKTIREKFIRGMIEPLEKIDLDEGKEITVTIRAISSPSKKKDVLEITAGGWKWLVDAEKLKRDIYSDRLIKTRREIKHEDFLSH
jgi:predicted DNA-binding antitoxin AbrB/MazE fold protein